MPVAWGLVRDHAIAISRRPRAIFVGVAATLVLITAGVAGLAAWTVSDQQREEEEARTPSD
jgi:flagellar basal body-associated protein FliL